MWWRMDGMRIWHLRWPPGVTYWMDSPCLLSLSRRTNSAMHHVCFSDTVLTFGLALPFFFISQGCFSLGPHSQVLSLSLNAEVLHLAQDSPESALLSWIDLESPCLKNTGRHLILNQIIGLSRSVLTVQGHSPPFVCLLFVKETPQYFPHGKKPPQVSLWFL